MAVHPSPLPIIRNIIPLTNPSRGQQESPSKTTLPAYDSTCYLCPGNTRAGGAHNPAYKSTFVFVNDYSAVKETQESYAPPTSSSSAGEEDDTSALFLRAEGVTGKCYVLTFSPSHNLTLADLSPAEILPVVEAWTAIYAAHLDPASPLAKVAPAPYSTLPARLEDATDLTAALVLEEGKRQHQLRYMQIFENKGAAMGCSNPHPHGQIWTTSSLPDEVQLDLTQLRKYRAEQGRNRHLLADYAALEMRKGERVVFANDGFVAVCPWWATWPFEVLLVARRHVRALVDLSAQERKEFAECIAEVTRRYDNLFETQFPYSMGLHQAPLSAAADREDRDSREGEE